MAENEAGNRPAGHAVAVAPVPRCHDVDVQTRELERLRAAAQAGAGSAMAAMRAAALASLAGSTTSLTLDLTTITPVFGGGTRPGEVDPFVPFRPRAIKNGIRNWWWLLNRHAPAYRVAAGDDEQARKLKKQQLYDALVDIWGGAAREGEELAAKVSIEVSDVAGVRLAPYAAYKVRQGNQGLRLQDDADDPWLYALFGARGEREPQAQVPPSLRPWAANGKTFAERYLNSQSAEAVAAQQALFKPMPEAGPGARKVPCALVVPGARLRLTLRWSKDPKLLTEEQQAQLQDALAFWLAFGGVGARTSRGLGRLSWNEDAFDAWARIQASSTAPEPRLTLVPAKVQPAASGPGQLGADETNSPERSILWLLGAYNRFRQSREPGGERPGRSHWHKAEVVRRADPGYKYRGHRTPLPAPFDEDWLPEMLFGAPIVVSFHGPDDPTNPVELAFAEPGGAVLNRYASPIFFATRRVQWQGEVRWQPHVLYLHAMADFEGRKLSVRVKRPGPAGAMHKDIPAGTWWIDFDDRANRSHQQRTRTNAFGKLPKPVGGAASLIDLFLKQVAAGKGRP